MRKDKKKEKEYLKKWRASPTGKASIAKYREKSKDQRKKWAKEYYKKNKIRLNAQSIEYRKTHPEVTKKTQLKNRDKNIMRGRKDRTELKPHYINALIKHSQSVKNAQDAMAYVLTKRIKRNINDISNEKFCSTCLKFCKKDSFTIRGKRKSGENIYAAHCNKCYSKIRKKYDTEKSKQQKRDAAKRWYQKNKELVKSRQKARYEQHKHIKKPPVRAIK